MLLCSCLWKCCYFSYEMQIWLRFFHVSICDGWKRGHLLCSVNTVRRRACFPSHEMFQFNSASPQVSSALKQIQFQRHRASPLDTLYDVRFTMTQRALKNNINGWWGLSLREHAVVVIFSPEDLNSSVWCGRTGSKDSSVTVYENIFRLLSCSSALEPSIHSTSCDSVAWIFAY